MNRRVSSFSGGKLLDSLNRLPSARRYWVGFSGGADSTALLLALHEAGENLPAPLHAVHFDHGLNDAAADWRKHCSSFCEERGIPYRDEILEIDHSQRSSLEESARNARYQAVARMLGDGEMYLTAHHAEDQAETLFLNLMRGSGIEGLAGIPVLRDLGRGWVARPLLDVHRQELVRFLEDRGVSWLEDPSNEDTAFDRNYLRQELFPLLEKRWPGLSKRLSRTARNARISSEAMASLIESQSGELLADRMRMPIRKLLVHDAGMQSLILRQWLRRHEVPALPEARLKELLLQLSDAHADNQAEVQWGDWALRRYRHDLWLQRRESLTPCADRSWSGDEQIDLGPDAGSYCLPGLEIPLPGNWRVGPRAAGDRIRAIEGGPSRKLKHCFQTASIPPWLRLGIPVLYWDDEPVALGDWVIGHRLISWLTEHELELVWKPADAALARVHSDCQH